MIALRTLACLAALAGGLVWAGRWFLGEGPTALFWVGLALITLALAAAGAGLVKKGTWWLRLIVAVAFPALVLSLYSAVRPAMDDTLLTDGVAGGLAAVLGLVFLFRAPARPRAHGAHAR